MKANLNGIDKLPLENGAFELFCAFDLLELLENFHLMNEKMYLLADNHLLASLHDSAPEILFGPCKKKATTAKRS
ncbi:hypothetical protein [Thalassospira indica]|uniref:Uncharacterized protein n=1 Tax=Thalassospira indica TaxID=1891279 RepID=A0ABN5NEP8_9PROT|nr:hypothetical protein [Thalassospira indica]AXO13644.1 hypothetical protein DY252_04975 [Thalassospira indica]OAZ14474.1 hypothetical protein TH15_01265 [Thalassospira profundimaris]